MPIKIPDGLTEEHIEIAIRDFDSGFPHDFGPSTGYDLIFDGKKYPPKAIIGLAARRLTGHQLVPSDFKGGVGSKCFRVLLNLGFQISPKTAPPEPGDAWTDDELQTTIEAYVQMLDLAKANEPFVKKDAYRELATIYGRSEKAYEYRFQNISAVLALLGRKWLPGLLPAKNVGTQVVARTERLLAKVESRPPSDLAEFESKVSQARKSSKRTKPKGNDKPDVTHSMRQSYTRDSEVKGWVLREAKGVCEACGENAPFVNHADEPFLEVHHVVTLADGGPDTIENAVAICPNCHRALHYAVDKDKRTENLYSKISRLNKSISS